MPVVLSRRERDTMTRFSAVVVAPDGVDYREHVEGILPRFIEEWHIGGWYTGLLDPSYDPTSEPDYWQRCSACNGRGFVTLGGSRTACNACTIRTYGPDESRRVLIFRRRGGGTWRQFWSGTAWVSVTEARLYEEVEMMQLQRNQGTPRDGGWHWARPRPGFVRNETLREGGPQDTRLVGEVLVDRADIKTVPMVIVPPDGRWHEASQHNPFDFFGQRRRRLPWASKFWAIMTNHPSHRAVLVDCSTPSGE